MDTTKDYHPKSEGQIPYVITYMWNLKHDTNRNRLTDIENRLVVAKGWGMGERWSGRSGLEDISFFI